MIPCTFVHRHMSQTKHIASQSRSGEQIRFHIVYMIMSQLNEFLRNQTALHIAQCAMVRFLTQYCHKHNCSNGNDYYLWHGIGKYTGERRNRTRFWWITIRRNRSANIYVTSDFCLQKMFWCYYKHCNKYGEENSRRSKVCLTKRRKIV